MADSQAEDYNVHLVETNRFKQILQTVKGNCNIFTSLLESSKTPVYNPTGFQAASAIESRQLRQWKIKIALSFVARTFSFISMNSTFIILLPFSFETMRLVGFNYARVASFRSSSKANLFNCSSKIPSSPLNASF